MGGLVHSASLTTVIFFLCKAEADLVVPLALLLGGGGRKLRARTLRPLERFQQLRLSMLLREALLANELLQLLLLELLNLLLCDTLPGGLLRVARVRLIWVRSKVIQLLAAVQSNLPLLLRSGILAALGVLAKSESVAKKQVSSNLLLRFATDSECRRTLLESGAARTLCLLSRCTLPRKVARPAVSALIVMSQLGACVPALLESGAGKALADLANSSDPELRVDGCKALADMLEVAAASRTYRPGRLSKRPNRPQ